MSHFRRHRYLALLWLAAFGVLYHGLIPAGFMPVLRHVSGTAQLSLVVCHGNHLRAAPDAPGTPGASDEQGDQACPYSASGSALPTQALALALTAHPPAPRSNTETHPAPGSTAAYLQPPGHAPPVTV